MHKIGAIVIPLLLLFQLLIVFTPTTQTSKAWWNTDWAYYKVCYINTNGYSGYYQMKLNVSYNGGGDVSCEGHCQAEFDDIRFVDIDNTTVLPYWKETYVDSQYAIFWINVSADAMSDGKILMYYGNPSATDESDGDDTFLFFDDFEGTSLDTTKWNSYTSNGEIIVENSLCKLHGFGSGAQVEIYSKTTFSEGIVEARAKAVYHSNILSLNDKAFVGEGGASNYFGIARTGDYSNFWTYSNDGTGESKQQSSLAYDDNFHKFKLVYTSDSFTYIDDDYEIDTSKDPSGNLKVYSRLFNTANTAEIDWVFIRKYADPEPTWSSFGSEKSSQHYPQVSNPNPQDGATGVSTSLSQLTVEISDPDGDLMNWTIETSPDIGSASGNNTANGTITCPVSGLEPETTYTWYVNVTDGTYWTNKTYTFATVDNNPPRINAISQTYNFIEPLGDREMHPTKGHNFLHGTFYDKGGLDYVYVECNISGITDGWEAMKEYPSPSWYSGFIELNNFSVLPLGARESFSVNPLPNGTFIAMYGDHYPSDENQAFHRMWSPDAIHFYNNTIVFNETDRDQAINCILHNGTLYSYQEDSLSGYIIELAKSTDGGKTWTAVKEWDPLSKHVQSPYQLIWNDTLYVYGESHISSDLDGYVLISDGIDFGNFSEAHLCFDVSAHPEIQVHAAPMAIWIDKNGVAHAYIDCKLPNGTWGHYYAETTNIEPYLQEPWTLIHFFPINSKYEIHNILKVFNGFYAYAIEDFDTVYVYKLNGTIEKHYFNGATTGTWTYEFYEPSLPEGTVVYWRFVVVDKSGNVNYSQPMSFTIGTNEQPIISNPSPSDGATDVDVSLSQLSIDISDPDGDLMDWTIETSPNIGSASGNNAGNGTITCSVSGLTYGTTYTWYVNVTDDTFWTNRTYTFTTETPDPPSNLKAVSVNISTIYLTWTKSPDTDTTVIVRKTGSYPTSITDGTVVYNGTAEEFTDTGLNPGTAYYYRAWSWAPNSYSSSYTQDMNYTYPDVPTDLQVTSFNDTSITISWTKGDGADMTKIYRGDTLVDTVSGTTYTDTGLTPSTLYTYHLYAYDSESGYSSLTSAGISQYTKPSPPHDFSFSGDQNIYMTWSKGTGADYTLIRYRNDSFPSSIDDGYLLYNGTGTSYYFPANNTLLYISAWSYDTDSKLYSDVAHAFYIVNLIPPTLSLSFLDNGSINVSWSVEVPEGINHSVMVRYSTTDYPSSISDGTLLINTSTSNYTILTDLTDGDYYFSAWTYGEKYGSSRWSSTYSTAHIRVYIKNISIVNEETGNPFNLSKVYSFLVLVPEKNWSLDLKAENVTSFEYNSSTADQLKFEVKYSSDSSTIVRYINISLITESNFTIGYPENITTFYEQMIYSKKRIPVLVKNIETGCYILAGETQFIREDVIYIPAYTINKMYRLYRYEDGRYSVIGLINGGEASEINLDLILYNTSTLFDIHLEGIGVKRISSNLFLIYYKNDNNDNQRVRIQIFDGDDVIFDYNETSMPNEFTIYFDISGLSLNNTNLKIKVTAVRTDGSERVIVKYFSTKGGYGILNSAVGAILAIGLMVFGISLVASRHAFGIVGIVLCGISIAITAISTSIWYITFLQAIFIIILVVIILIYKEQNKGVVY